MGDKLIYLQINDPYRFDFILSLTTSSAFKIEKKENNIKKGGRKMKLNEKGYKKYAEARATKSPILKDCLKAFLFGGSICTVAQGLKETYSSFLSEEDAGALVSVTLVFITAFLTGIGVFDKIAKHAGAGTLVPITGFANAVSSCAIDARGEGYILGVGANMFKVAGPVIVYGTVAGAVYGVIYWIIKCVTGA